jgi:hypothetical protein
MIFRGATGRLKTIMWRGAFALMFILAGAAIPSIAHAQVVSASARYDRGTLVVHGKTAKPRQYVRLNRFRIKLSNNVGQFAFHQTRLPRTCSVRLRSAGHGITIPIRNCPLRER